MPIKYSEISISMQVLQFLGIHFCIFQQKLEKKVQGNLTYKKELFGSMLKEGDNADGDGRGGTCRKGLQNWAQVNSLIQCVFNSSICASQIEKRVRQTSKTGKNFHARSLGNECYDANNATYGQQRHYHWVVLNKDGSRRVRGGEAEEHRGQ